MLQMLWIERLSLMNFSFNVLRRSRDLEKVILIVSWLLFKSSLSSFFFLLFLLSCIIDVSYYFSFLVDSLHRLSLSLSKLLVWIFNNFLFLLILRVRSCIFVTVSFLKKKPRIYLLVQFLCNLRFVVLRLWNFTISCWVCERIIGKLTWVLIKLIETAHLLLWKKHLIESWALFSGQGGILRTSFSLFLRVNHFFLHNDSLELSILDLRSLFLIN